MKFFARLRERSGGKQVRFVRDLRGLYLDVRRVATQLRRHAGQVPYPALGVELRRLAEQAEGQAAALADELRAVAGNADPSDPMAPREGRNHWERLTVNLSDLETIRRCETELALRWDLDFPAPALVLARLAQVTASMSAAVRVMLARSDPHAA
jgi:hypothetical protein